MTRSASIRPEPITRLAILLLLPVLSYGFVSALGMSAALSRTGSASTLDLLLLSGACAGISLLHLLCAIGLWRMQSFGRSLLLLLCLLWAIIFPVGTLVALLLVLYVSRPVIRRLFRPQAGPWEDVPTPDSSRPEGFLRVSLAGITMTLLVGGFLVLFAAAALVIPPRLLPTAEHNHQQRTMSELRVVGAAIKRYELKHNRYPGPTTGTVPVEKIEADLQPFLANPPLQDGWDQPLLYWSDTRSYRLISLAGDGILEDEPIGGPADGLDCDIVLADGHFVQWPRGTTP